MYREVKKNGYRTNQEKKEKRRRKEEENKKTVNTGRRKEKNNREKEKEKWRSFARLHQQTPTPPTGKSSTPTERTFKHRHVVVKSKSKVKENITRAHPR